MSTWIRTKGQISGHSNVELLPTFLESLKIRQVSSNKYCMSCHGKDMGQLLVDYESVWPIGPLSIEISPHPF